MTITARPPELRSIPKTMKAAVLFGPGDMRVVDKPVPKPAAGEVLVQVAMCGMCGTDLTTSVHTSQSAAERS